MSDIKKIQLVFPPSVVDGVGMEDCFIPNGILCIAGYISKKFPDISIEILDGSIINIDEILKQVEFGNADLVGISTLTGNYSNAKNILNLAKQKGAYTVIGNHHANYLYHLCNDINSEDLADIDFIIEGIRGEYTFEKLINALIKETSFQNIQSLAYKDNGKLKTNLRRVQYPPLRERTESDLSFIKDFTPYFKAYHKRFAEYHKDINNVRQININYVTGCLQGCVDACIYCCLKDHVIEFLNPVIFWEKIEKLINEDFNYFFETCNSLTSLDKISRRRNQVKSYLYELVTTMPSSIKDKFQMMIYARANEINDITVEHLKRLN
ncbi:cobalamin-dependent protein, partial [candidate division KSB1 bacterium]